MEEFRAEVERECVEWGNIDINEFNKIVMRTANRILKTKYRKKMKGEDGEEPPWINEEIRKEIAKRKKTKEEAQEMS